MPQRKTNSNSITVKLKNMLNNKKSGFRNEMLKRFGLTNPNTIFVDGTHSPICLPDMQSKEIDIFARVNENTKPVLLLEVKANIDEDLQDSQKINGAYETTAKNEDIPLFYIIPNGYVHEKEIPKIANIIFWDEILEKANQFDNTGFSEDILSFVENLSTKRNLLNKSETILLFSPKIIRNFLNLLDKLDVLLDNYESSKRTLIFKSKKENGKDYFGRYIFIKKGKKEIKLWIGFCPDWQINLSYYIQVIDTNIFDETKGFVGQDYYKTYYEDYSDFQIYFPVFDSNDVLTQNFLNCDDENTQQKEFNQLLNSLLTKILSYIK